MFLRPRRAELIAPVAFLLSITVMTFSGLAKAGDLRAGQVIEWGGGDVQWLSGLTRIAAGEVHSLGVREDGTVMAWGANTEDQCRVPSGLSNVVGIAAGDEHSLALTSNGQVVAWGDDQRGQCKVPDGLENVTAVAAGGVHSLAVKKDGTVVAWGGNTYGQCDIPVGLTNVVAVRGGGTHSLALKGDGNVVAWGNNQYGQCDVPSDLSEVTAIGAGRYHSLALKDDGSVIAWGRNEHDQCDIPEEATDVTAIAAGDVHSLALKNNGKVIAWGYNLYDQCEVPEGIDGVTAIAAGWDYSLALTHDGTGGQISGIVSYEDNETGTYLVQADNSPRFTGTPIGSAEISEPGSYAISGLFAGNYFVRAFYDKNNDGDLDLEDPDGTYAQNPVNINNTSQYGVDISVDPLDSDNDGIIDDWEKRIINADPEDEIDTIQDVNPEEDFDGDGFSNLQEFENEMEPTNYLLELRSGWNLVSIALAPEDFTVENIVGDKISPESSWCWTSGEYEKAENMFPTEGCWVHCDTSTVVDIGNMQFPDSEDTDGDGLCDDVERDIGTDPEEYVITLNPGWNLVSICRVPKDNTPAAIFGDAVTTPVWEWREGGYKEAEKIRPLQGYWVFNGGQKVKRILLSIEN